MNRRSLGIALRNLIIAVALVGVTALVTTRVVSEEPPIKGPDYAQMTMEDMKKAWQAKNATGKHHENLKAFAGTWQAECSSYFPGAPEPEKSKGISKNSIIHDGRFLKQEFRGTMMGDPFEGVGYLGYDNTTQKYTNVWLDNMTTGIMVEEGICDESGKLFTLTGECKCPMDGKDKKMKTVMKIVSANKYELEMWMDGPDGKPFKNMSITYTRK